MISEAFQMVSGRFRGVPEVAGDFMGILGVLQDVERVLGVFHRFLRYFRGVS